MGISTWSKWVRALSSPHSAQRRRSRSAMARLDLLGPERLEHRQLLSGVNTTAADIVGVSRATPKAGSTVHIFFFSVGAVEVQEGPNGTSTTVNLTIFASPSPKKDIQIDGKFEVSGEGDGFADENDFDVSDFHVTMRKNQSSVTVQATIFGDNLVEPDESFRARITKVSPGAVIDGSPASFTILNDDEPVDPSLPNVSFVNATGQVATEGETQNFTLQLDAMSDVDVTVTVHLASASKAATGNIPATVPADVQFAGGETDLVVVIPAMTLTKSFSVSLVDDSALESTESYSVSIKSAVNANLGTPLSQVAAIADNDAPPTVSVQAVTEVTEGNTGTLTVPVTISLSQATDHDVTIKFKTAVANLAPKSQRATTRKDFLPITGTVTIAAGQTTGTALVKVVGDTQVEADEKFIVKLLSVNGATLDQAHSSGEVVILNDDESFNQFSARTKGRNLRHLK